MTLSRAEMAERIEMLFGMWTRVGPWNQVLDGDRDTTRSGAKVDILSGGRTGANADWGLLEGCTLAPPGKYD